MKITTERIKKAIQNRQETNYNRFKQAMDARIAYRAMKRAGITEIPENSIAYRIITREMEKGGN